MPPRVVIFVGLSGDGPRAAAGAACELAPAGSARPITLDPAQADGSIRRAADGFAGALSLRPVAWELAVLGRITTLLQERPDATVVLDAARPSILTRLLETADLARATLDDGRPPEGTSSLAAHRAAAASPTLAALRAAATAGDLLRAPELTTVGLAPTTDAPRPAATVGASHPDQRVIEARTALAFSGLPVLPALLPDDPVAAAEAVLAAGGAPGRTRDPAPITRATPEGAEISLALPDRPDDLRAVRAGAELALHGAGLTRRLQAPASLGQLEPHGVAAGAAGAVVATFAARVGPDDAGPPGAAPT